MKQQGTIKNNEISFAFIKPGTCGCSGGYIQIGPVTFFVPYSKRFKIKQGTSAQIAILGFLFCKKKKKKFQKFSHLKINFRHVDLKLKSRCEVSNLDPTRKGLKF